MTEYFNFAEQWLRGALTLAGKVFGGISGVKGALIAVFMISAVSALIIVPLRGRFIGGASDAVRKERKHE